MVDEVQETAATETAEGPVRPTLTTNIVATIAARVGYMVTRVAIPPFVLAHIGLEAYGLWTTAFILVGYLGLSTIGVSIVYIKSFAELEAKRDYDRANELLSTGLMLTVPLAAAAMLVTIFGWPVIANIIHLPVALATEGRIVVQAVVAVFLLSSSVGAFGDVLNGVQQIALTQRVWVISYLIETAMIFVLVGMGRGLRGMAEAFLFRTLLSTVMYVYYAYRTLPWLNVSVSRATRRAAKEFLHLGGVVQLQMLLSLTLTSAERIAAVLLLGVEAAGLFDLAKKWPGSASAVPSSFLSAFMPKAAQLQSESGSREAVSDMYIRGSRYMNLSGVYFFALFAVLSPAILTVWLKQHLEHAALMFTLFSIAMQVHMLTGPATSILRGIGRVYEEFYYSLPNLVTLLIFVPLSHVIMHGWTVVGVGVAVCVSTLISAVILLIRAHHVLRISTVVYVREVLLPGLVPYAAAALLLIPVTAILANLDRLQQAGVLVVTGFVYTVLVAVGLFPLSSTDERQRIRGYWNRALEAMGAGAAVGAAEEGN
jgi:O-antigen/teichoic acid export membrane protein